MSNEMMHIQPASLLPRGNATTMIAQSREMAEAVSAMQMAKAFPRDVVAARDRILNACTRPKLAEAACYTYVRGGTEITGPSIRLAEMLAQNWGNMQFGIREIEQRNGESTCEAFAWDMETNARQTKTFQVAHIRYTRNGTKPLTDPRDIYELIANNGARRLRACILGIIPGDIVEEAVNQCDLTNSTTFEVTKERIKSMCDKFATFGVKPEQIEKRIQCHLDAMKPAQLANLAKIYNSLKDGMSKPEDWFPTDSAAAAAGKGENKTEVPVSNADKLRKALKIPTNPPKTPQGASEAVKEDNGSSKPANAVKGEISADSANEAVSVDDLI